MARPIYYESPTGVSSEGDFTSLLRVKKDETRLKQGSTTHWTTENDPLSDLPTGPSKKFFGS